MLLLLNGGGDVLAGEGTLLRTHIVLLTKRLLLIHGGWSVGRELRLWLLFTLGGVVVVIGESILVVRGPVLAYVM